jgi:hypothetical protein
MSIHSILTSRMLLNLRKAAQVNPILPVMEITTDGFELVPNLHLPTIRWSNGSQLGTGMNRIISDSHIVANHTAAP